MSIQQITDALEFLNDRICQHERMAGMGYTVIVIPHDITQPVQVSIDGKPVDTDPEQALVVSMVARNEVGSDDDAWVAR